MAQSWLANGMAYDCSEMPVIATFGHGIIDSCNWLVIPVVLHKAVAEVSKIGNL